MMSSVHFVSVQICMLECQFYSTVMYWHAGAATVFQHQCVFVLADVLLWLFSAGSCGAHVGTTQTHTPTVCTVEGSLPSTNLTLITRPAQREQVSWGTYSTHCAWACVVNELLRHLTSTNFNVIISACSRSNNTLLSSGGTVTPAC